jgi:hypothetical protein
MFLWFEINETGTDQVKKTFDRMGFLFHFKACDTQMSVDEVLAGYAGKRVTEDRILSSGKMPKQKVVQQNGVISIG